TTEQLYYSQQNAIPLYNATVKHFEGMYPEGHDVWNDDLHNSGPGWIEPPSQYEGLRRETHAGSSFFPGSSYADYRYNAPPDPFNDIRSYPNLPSSNQFREDYYNASERPGYTAM